MSVAHIPAGLRRAVRARAAGRCEYCGIREEDTEYGCEVDHIISEKHSGQTVSSNLALACFFCNRHKGSDIGSILSSDEPVFVRFYNPRIDEWTDHFYLDGDLQIVGKSDIGRVTARVLAFNTDNRLMERKALR